MTTSTRRSFLHASAAFGAFQILNAEDKAGIRRSLLGVEGHQYEVYHDWLTPPQGLMWGDTHGVAQDAQGHIYIGHTVNPASVKKDAIVVFDQAGKFVRSWGEQFAGGTVGGSHGLDIRDEGGTEFIYHCDNAHQEFTKTTLDGTVIWKKGYPKEAPPYAGKKPIKWNCTNVAFHPDGDFYLADGYGSAYILRYDKDANFKGIIGTPGNADGQFKNTHGLWVDTRHSPAKLVVADRGNGRLQIFSLDGQHERTVKVPGVIRLPCHFHVQGDLMVCPDLYSVVHLLDKDYHVITSLGDGKEPGQKRPWPLRLEPKEKFVPGKFITPHDAMILANGDILVTEWVPVGRVTLLKKVA